MTMTCEQSRPNAAAILAGLAGSVLWLAGTFAIFAAQNLLG
jgi:hypothetical protein